MHQDKKRTKGGSVMRGLGAALLMLLPAMVFGQDAPPPPKLHLGRRVEGRDLDTLIEKLKETAR